MTVDAKTRPCSLTVVGHFCRSWETGDLEQIAACLHDDAEWENVPMGIVRGKVAIEERLRAVFSAVEHIEWDVLNSAATRDDQVLTERVDRIKVNGQMIELRLMGIFRVTDGKISLWRDYFDLQSYQNVQRNAGVAI